MADKNMAFLNARRLVRWDTNAQIHALEEIPASAPGQSDSVQSQALCGGQPP